MLKTSLLPRELWINNWYNMGMDQPIENHVGDTKQRYWIITLRILHWLLWLWDHDYQCTSLDFGNFELMQAEKSHKTRNLKQLKYGAWALGK